MKIFYLIGVFLLNGGWLQAQTNTVAPKLPPEATQIDSDNGVFTAHQAVYRGHVRVNDPQMKLTCAQLTVDLPPAGGRVSHIVAETNVVIDFVQEKNQTNHAASDRAVYVYNVQNGVTNETVTFNGHAKIENTQGWLTGEPIIWNRANNSLTATNQHMIFRQTLNSLAPPTNSPAVKTNFPARTIGNIATPLSPP